MKEDKVVGFKELISNQSSGQESPQQHLGDVLRQNKGTLGSGPGYQKREGETG